MATTVISVIGLLGSGKSSVVRALLDGVHERRETAGVVINDSGEVALDVEEVTSRHPVVAIGGG